MIFKKINLFLTSKFNESSSPALAFYFKGHYLWQINNLPANICCNIYVVCYKMTIETAGKPHNNLKFCHKIHKQLLYGVLNVALFDIFTLLFCLIYLYLKKYIFYSVSVYYHVYFSICMQYPFFSIVHFPIICYILSFVFYNFQYYFIF